MSTTDFINQRRRWLNGAFFSNIYALGRYRALSESGHTILRKLLFYIQKFHSILALVLAWFSFAAFLLTNFTINSIAGDPPPGQPISGFPFGKATPVFILALGSRPRNHKVAYMISLFIFGLGQVYLAMSIVYLIKRVAHFQADIVGESNYAYIGEFYTDLGAPAIIVSTFSVFGVYILSGLLARDPWHLLTSFAHNTRDVTWGQKLRAQELPSGRPPGVGASDIERRFTFNDQGSVVGSAATKRDDSPEARDREYDAAVRRP
ncbi:hypothetical protein DL771_002275 [Monosporascus sp. 5C6A]|nr:hypothetical protein DL771_002275 [Monosporascus sp. 5C6A]